KLRSLWALWVIDGIDEAFLLDRLTDGDEHLRAWAARLLAEDSELSADEQVALRRLADEDNSPLVRLHLASLLQRVPAVQRWDIARALASRDDDVDDANLPLMLWYAIEPLVLEDTERFIDLALTARSPL